MKWSVRSNAELFEVYTKGTIFRAKRVILFDPLWTTRMNILGFCKKKIIFVHQKNLLDEIGNFIAPFWQPVKYDHQESMKQRSNHHIQPNFHVSTVIPCNVAQRNTNFHQEFPSNRPALRCLLCQNFLRLLSRGRRWPALSWLPRRLQSAIATRKIKPLVPRIGGVYSMLFRFRAFSFTFYDIYVPVSTRRWQINLGKYTPRFAVMRGIARVSCLFHKFWGTK